MSLLEVFFGRMRRKRAQGPSAWEELRARLPDGGAPGLLPPIDPAQAEAERLLGERFANELHAWAASEPAGLGRRVAAIVDAARRRRTDELEEALAGLHPWDLPHLLPLLEARGDLDQKALLDLARRLVQQVGDVELLAAALGLLALGPTPEDRTLLGLACRSPALAGVCAMSAEPLGPAVLLDLAREAEGLGRALVLERMGLAAAEGGASLDEVAIEAFELAATIEDPIVRAWAAVPLLEVVDVPALLASSQEVAERLADPVAACLESSSRGGWNGGPGPGLGRSPGAIRAAQALLEREGPEEVRRRVARAVLDAHPLPPGEARLLAERMAAAGS